MHRRVSRYLVSLVVLAMLLSCCSRGNDAADLAEPSLTVVVDGVDVALVPAQIPQAQVADHPEELRERIAGALEAGGSYSESVLDQVDPVSLVFFDYLWRNWQIEGLNEARALSLRAPLPSSGEAGALARLIDPSVLPPEDLDGLELSSLLLASALHCDLKPLPDNFIDHLATTVRNGDENQLSHAAYAIGWTRELGCLAPDLDPIAAALAEKMRTLLSEAEVVDDLSLQLSVGLSYLGRADLIPTEWIELVLEAQHGDGGWLTWVGDSESNWHPTCLALWTLAAASSPGAAAPMLTFA